MASDNTVAASTMVASDQVLQRSDGASAPHATYSDTGHANDAGAVRRRARRRDAALAARSALLRQAIVADIVPRLLQAHPAPVAPAAAPPSEAVIDGLARLAMATDSAALDAALDEVVAEGLPLERVFLDLLEPAARRMGTMWDNDLCGFSDVTLGTWRLQQSLHRLSPGFLPRTLRHDQRRHVLITPMPGDQHGLGSVMVGEFLRRAGWQVESGPLDSLSDLLRRVRRDWFAIVGLSVGAEDRLDPLTTAITAVRRLSRNRDIAILVGGPPFTARPELATMVGADATAADARGAVRGAEALFRRSAGAAAHPAGVAAGKAEPSPRSSGPP